MRKTDGVIALGTRRTGTRQPTTNATRILLLPTQSSKHAAHLGRPFGVALATACQVIELVLQLLAVQPGLLGGLLHVHSPLTEPLRVGVKRGQPLIQRRLLSSPLSYGGEDVGEEGK